jgi:hypothetical protein
VLVRSTQSNTLINTHNVPHAHLKISVSTKSELFNDMLKEDRLEITTALQLLATSLPRLYNCRQTVHVQHSVQHE